VKALITGATGFTGSHLTKKLLQEENGVRILVRSKEKASSIFGKSPVEIVRGDLEDVDAIRNAVKGIDTVFHIAAMYREAGLPESRYHEVNAGGTENLLKASLENNVKKFVHCSTIGVLGNISSPPGDEETPYNPGDEYQRSKMEGEIAALKYNREFGLPVTVVRPAAIYGPGDMRLFKLFRMVARRRAIILGSGETLYHMVYIADLVRGFLLAAETERAVGEVFIIGGEGYVTLRKLYEMIALALGMRLTLYSLPLKPVMAVATIMEKILPPFGISPPLYRRRVDFFSKNRAFDISKAKDILGYNPEHSMEAGIAETATWYREKGLL